MILCCGEALIDMLPDQTAAGDACFVPRSGGAIFNTALALGRLGIEVGMVTGLSTDMFGKQLKRDLVDSQVDVSHIVYSNRPTTLAFVQIVNGHANYAFYDENTAGRMLEKPEISKISRDTKAMFFGGISLACEPCGSSYAALCLEHAKHLPIMLDPNIRPAFIENEAAYRERLTRMLGVVDIVKVSDEDLDWIQNGAIDIFTKAQTLLDHGPTIVILTQGENGAAAFRKGHDPVEIKSPMVDVVDTVGAGDTFNAGFLASLVQQNALNRTILGNLSSDVLRKALLNGAQIAAVTVGRAGANPPWASEL